MTLKWRNSVGEALRRIEEWPREVSSGRTEGVRAHYGTKHSKIDIKNQEIPFPENNRSSGQGSEVVADLSCELKEAFGIDKEVEINEK